jgi:carbamoyl-phosphate synthase large subunit
VVKGKFYDAKVAFSVDQAMQHFNKISGQWGLPILIQEFVRMEVRSMFAEPEMAKAI